MVVHLLGIKVGRIRIFLNGVSQYQMSSVVGGCAGVQHFQRIPEI